MGASGREARIETIWDAPTRLLKWAIAAAVAVNLVMGQILSFTNVGTHITVGYVIGGLLVARLLWGFVGAPASRIGTMIGAALQAPAYLRHRLFKTEPSHWPGHNPLGSLWVLTLFAVLAFQVGTGLITYSDSFFEGGPLHQLVGDSWSAWANGMHALAAKILIGLIALHLFAIIFYAVWKREDLISAMISGRKTVVRPEKDAS